MGQFYAGICKLACFFAFFHFIWTSIWLKVHKKWSDRLPFLFVSSQCISNFPTSFFVLCPLSVFALDTALVTLSSGAASKYQKVCAGRIYKDQVQQKAIISEPPFSTCHSTVLTLPTTTTWVVFLPEHSLQAHSSHDYPTLPPLPFSSFTSSVSTHKQADEEDTLPAHEHFQFKQAIERWPETVSSEPLFSWQQLLSLSSTVIKY